MALNMHNEIISDHRERMLNLKKYYPFFKLIDISFSQYKEGKYEILDMGYILMAILRFFIEENNFKEKDVTYPEYLEFITKVVKGDFGLELTNEEYKGLADYIFDKVKNDGKPFEFTYFDPVDKKKRVSRQKIIESQITDSTVWYSISPEAVEFYLDTKEIKDESKISVQQLLLEKMIKTQNFKGGTEVIERINEEVNRLQLKKNEVLSTLSCDVFAGIEAYEEFVDTGMRWFADEEKLFKKNKELIEAALKKMESTGGAGEGYYNSISDIYNLENQLKVAMNKHGDLLRACTDMQKLTDDAVRRAKLGRLRSHMDFSTALNDMIKTDRAQLLEQFLRPLFKPNIKKRFPVNSIDNALLVKPAKYEKAERVSLDTPEDIIFEDELANLRIRDNYIFIMDNLVACLNKRKRISLKEFNEAMAKAYGDGILKNGDYYGFFVNLCHKNNYVIGGLKMESQDFIDEILKEHYEGKDEVSFEIDRQEELLHICEDTEITNLIFEIVKPQINSGI
ncbi:MAG: hypothetical protein Q4F11_00495 [Eubacteriales bacterium]|nr:hypothetical protein [Eubacteriales bacterium]